MSQRVAVIMKECWHSVIFWLAWAFLFPVSLNPVQVLLQSKDMFGKLVSGLRCGCKVDKYLVHINIYM